MDLDRSERIRLIKEVATRLDEDESWTNALLTLQVFEIGTPDREYLESVDSDYGYFVYCVKDADDATLIGLRAHLDPDEEGPAPTDDPRDVPGPGHWREGYFGLFISHTTANRKLAAAISEALRSHGIDGFVAHADIRPGDEWRDEIELALATCDAMLAIVTEDFIGSEWCDQEVGFIVGRGKLIIPVRQGVNPHGFFGKYQGIPGETEQFAAEILAGNVMTALEENELTRTAMATAKVQRYAESHSFDDARTSLRRVMAIPADLWTQKMIDVAEKAGEENVDLRDGVLYSDPIPKALRDHLAARLDWWDPPADVSDFGDPVSADDDIPF